MSKIQAVVSPSYRGSTEVTIARRIVPDFEAEIALDISRQLAIACAAPDGEDSSGRAKLRLMSPAEVAARSCQIAACLVAEFAERCWLVEIPLPTPPTPRTPEE